MKTFRIEMTATKVVEVTLSENDLVNAETLDEGAANVAREAAFHNSYPDMVRLVEDWDLTVEEVRPLKTA